MGSVHISWKHGSRSIVRLSSPGLVSSRKTYLPDNVTFWKVPTPQFWLVLGIAHTVRSPLPSLPLDLLRAEHQSPILYTCTKPPVFSFLYGTTLLSPAEILLMLNFPLVSKVVWNLLSEADVQYSKRCSQRRWAIFPLKQVMKHLLPSLNQNKVKLSKSEHLSLHMSENLELEAWPIVVLIRMSQS